MPAGSELNFHQLRIFYAVARCGSFSRAADALDISQPAVSIQVQELERTMGVTLVHRRSKGLQLTDIGGTVYDYAHRIFSLSTEMQETLLDIRGLQTGHLTLGASTTPGEYILPVAIGRFRQRYPGIRVELRISNTRAIVNQILQRELDLGMIGADVGAENRELNVSAYTQDEIVMVIGRSQPIGKGSRVTLDDVLEMGLVVREEGSATRKTAEEEFVRLGMLPRVVLELGSNQAVKLAAEAGAGVGVISRYGVGAEVKAGLLRVLDVEGWDCTRPLALVYLKEKRLSPAQRAFLDLLESEHPLPTVT